MEENAVKTGYILIILLPLVLLPIWIQIAATPTPEVQATLDASEQAQVGANASLICGASLLVLIIIGGVVWNTRRKRKTDS
jgi:flagellar biogenesis protein FliO